MQISDVTIVTVFKKGHNFVCILVDQNNSSDSILHDR